MKKNNLFTIPTIIFSVSFIGGFIHASINIITEKYLYYSMYNLIIMTYTNIITHWIIIGLLIYLLTLFFNFIVQISEKKILSSNISRENRQRLKKSFLILSIFLFILLYIILGYCMNKYYIPFGKLHKISLIADSVLAVILIMIWVIILKRKKFIKLINTLFAKKYTHHFSLILLIIFIGLQGFLFYNKKINNNHPNIVLIIVDTLRADHLGCHGYFRNTSPHIDTLSKEGFLFKNAISPAPWTSPAVASILSSKYPAIMGITHDPVILSDEHLMMAEILKQNFYKTKGIISHTFIGRELNYHQGFDSFDQENAWGGHFAISSPSITRKAIDYINKNKKNKFFLFLHYFDPHFTFILHEKYNYFPDYNGEITSGMGITTLRENAKYFSENDLKYLRALYDSEISFTDYYIGKVINHLKKLDLYNDTMIIFTADHGESFCDRTDWIGHGRTLYQELIHVPLIIKLPGKKEHQQVNKHIGTIDIMPTILSNLQLNTPEKVQFDGKSINLSNINNIEDRIIISDTKRQSILESVVYNSIKVIKNSKKNTYEIYNLSTDPHERNNLSPSFDDENIHNLKIIIEEWKKYVLAEKSQIGNVKKPHLSKKERARLKSLGYM